MFWYTREGVGEWKYLQLIFKEKERAIQTKKVKERGGGGVGKLSTETFFMQAEFE